MSKPIEERIVSIAFESSDFLKELNRTEKKFDELNYAVESFGKNRGFEDANKHIDSLGVKFDTLQYIVANAISGIVNNSLATLGRTLKSLTFDNIFSGYSKYEQKTNALQTLISAVREDTESEEHAMGRVNEQLEKMMWYSDETSANFTDMVDAMGMFTSKGIELKESADAIIGITNWGYTLGRTPAEMRRVMVNLSQSLGSYVKLQDWMSVESANMDDAKFKQLAIDTAKELGELSETSHVTINNFRDTLSEAWLTPEVLMKTLERYGALTAKVHAWTNDMGVTTTTFLDSAEKYSQMIEEGLSEDEIKEKFILEANEIDLSIDLIDNYIDALKEATSAENQLGLRALRAGQNALTFTQAIQSVKDALSTRFMTIFDHLFGDFINARMMWTDLSERLFMIFVDPIDEVIEGIKIWSDKGIGGRQALVDSIWNIFDAVKSLANAASEVFGEIFGYFDAEEFANNLANIVNKFREWTEILVLKDWTTFKDILRIILSTIKIAANVIKTIIAFMKPIIKALQPATSFVADKLTLISYKISEIATGVEKSYENLSEGIDENGELSIVKFLRKSFDLIDKLGGLIIDKLKPIASWIGKNFNNIFTALSNDLKGVNWWGIIEGVLGLTAVVEIAIALYWKWYAWFKVHDIGNSIKQMFENIGGIFYSMSVALEGGAKSKMMLGIAAIIVAIGIISKIDRDALYHGLSAFIIVVGTIFLALGVIHDMVSTEAEGLIGYTKDTVNLTLLIGRINSMSDIVRRLANTFLIIAASFTLMSFAVSDWGKFVRTLIAFGIIIAAFAVFIKTVNKQEGLKAITENMKQFKDGVSGFSDNVKHITGLIKNMAFSILIVAGVLFVISKLIPNFDVLVSLIGGLAAVFGTLIVFIKIVNEIQVTNKMLGNAGKLTAFVSILGGAFTILAGSLLALRVLTGGFDSFLDNMTSLLACFVALESFTILAKAFDNVKLWSIIKTAAMMTMFAVSLTALYIPINAISKINTDSFSSVVIAFTLLMTALAAGGAMASIPVIVKGMAIFTIALYGISGAFTLFAYGFNIFMQAIVSSADSLITFATSMSLIGRSLKQFADAVSEIKFFGKILSAISILIMLSMAAKIAEKFADAMDKIGNAINKIKDVTKSDMQVVSENLKAFLDTAKEIVIDFVMFIPRLISYFFLSLSETIPEIVQNFYDFVINLLDVLTTNRSKIIQALIDYVDTLIDTLGEKYELGSKLFDLLILGLSYLADFLESNSGKVTSIVERILNVLVDVIVGLLPDLVKTIVDLLPELLGGLIGGIVGAIFKNEELGDAIYDWFTSADRQKSPAQAAIENWINDRKKDVAALCAGFEFVTSFGSKDFNGLLKSYYNKFGVTGISSGATTHASSSGTAHGGGGFSDNIGVVGNVNVPNVSGTTSSIYRPSTVGSRNEYNDSTTNNNEYNIDINVTGTSDPKETAQYVLDSLNREIAKAQAHSGGSRSF